MAKDDDTVAHRAQALAAPMEVSASAPTNSSVYVLYVLSISPLEDELRGRGQRVPGLAGRGVFKVGQRGADVAGRGVHRVVDGIGAGEKIAHGLGDVVPVAVAA